MCLPNQNNQQPTQPALAIAQPAEQPQVAPAAQTPATPQADPFDYSEKYNTKLSPKQEAQFQKWAEANNRAGDSYDYDIRGAWKELQSGKMKEADNGHLGDKYKKPNHPTFSDQSIYSGKEGVKGGTWGKDEKGNDTFTPSPNHLWGKQELQRYFEDRERNAVLLDNR